MARGPLGAASLALALAGCIIGATGAEAQQSSQGGKPGFDDWNLLDDLPTLDMESASPLRDFGCTLQADGSISCEAPPSVPDLGPPELPHLLPHLPNPGSVVLQHGHGRGLELIIMSADGPADASPFSEGRATRTFAGPGEYPPDQFGAYAILAFKSRPTSADRSRYLMICQAFMSTIPEARSEDAPDLQLVTVWPIDSDAVAAEIRSLPDDVQSCELAVDHYDLAAAQSALRDAREVAPDIWHMIRRSRGPFLLAWNPGASKGKPDTLILRISLGNVNQMDWAKSRFEFWVQEIERNPQLWVDGWQQETIKERMAMWADDTGVFLLDFIIPDD